MSFSRFNPIIKETTPDKVAGIKIMAPASGEVTIIDSEAASNSQEGVQIKLAGHHVLAPFSGLVSQVDYSHGHIILKAKNNIRFAIQLPPSYSKFLGEGVKMLVKEGQTIAAGQDIMTLDLYKVQLHLKPAVLQVILLDNNPFSRVLVPLKNVEAGKDILFSLIPKPTKPNS